MAAGALTLTNHGSYYVSAAALKTKVDSITLAGGLASGAIFLVPIAGGMQIQLITIAVA